MNQSNNSDIGRYLTHAFKDFDKMLRDIKSEKKNRRMWKLARKKK